MSDKEIASKGQGTTNEVRNAENTIAMIINPFTCVQILSVPEM